MAFGAGDGDISLKIVLDAAKASGDAKKFFDDFQKGVTKLNTVNKELDTALAKVGNTATAAGKSAADSFGSANKSIRVTVGGITDLNSAAQLGKLAMQSLGNVITGTLNLLDDAAKFEGVTRSFEALQTKAGELGGETLDQLRKNTQGLISDFGLMQKTNQALLLGLPNDKFVALTSDAIKLGKAMGLDATNAVESLTLGIGRQSRLILDNLGIIVNAEDAYANFAEANNILGRDLTETEKKLAFTEEAFSKITERADSLPPALLNAADAFQKLQAELENQRQKAAETVGANENLADSLNRVAEELKSSGLAEGIADLGAELLSLGLDAATGAVWGLQLLGRAFSDLDNVQGVIDQINAVKKANDDFVNSVASAPSKIADYAGSIKDQAVASFNALTKSIKETDAERGKLASKLGSEAFGVDEQFATIKPEQVKAIRTELEGLYKAQRSGAISGEQATKQLKDYQATIKLTSAQTKDFETIATRSFSKSKTAVDAYGRSANKGISDATRELKNQERQLESFSRSISDAFDVSVPQSFQRAVEQALSSNAGNPEAIVSALKQIGLEAQKAGVSLTSLGRVVKDNQDSAVLGPGNKAGEAEFKQQRTSAPDAAQIFGFDTGFSQQIAGVIQDGLSQAFSIVVQSLTFGVGREDVAAIGGAIGSSIANAILPGSGPIGQTIGILLGQVAADIGKDTSGTKARKAADKFFADAFDADRLSIIVNGEIKRIEDLVFNSSAGGGKNGLFGGLGGAGGALLGDPTGGALTGGLGSQLGRSKPDSFADGSFDDGLAAASAQTQSFFNAVGAGFEQLLGVSEEVSGQIAAVLFNNIGGSLVNLQAVVQATGKTFEEFADAAFQAFFNGEIGVIKLQESLIRLNQIFEVGIPDKIGAVDEAAQNLQISLSQDKGSRIIFNSLRGIGKEADEVGKSLGDAAISIATALGIGAENVALVLEAMKLSGINSIDELVKAGNNKLAAFAANLKVITEGGTPTFTPVVAPTDSITNTPNFTPRTTSFGGGGGGSKPIDKGIADAQRAIESLRQETQKMIVTTRQYKDITEALNSGQLDSAKAGNKIRELYDGQFKALQKLTKAQEAYDKALAKGVKGAKLAELAKSLNVAEKAVDKFSGKVDGLANLDLSSITDLIKDMNTLGVVSRAVGVSTQAIVSTLVQGFKRGKLSISEVNDEIRKTKDLMGDGIPGAVGAVKEAFENLQKGGENGGVFSIDAFKDVFAEFDELFKKNGGDARKAQFKGLTDAFNTTRDALQQGINFGNTPEQVENLQKRFDGAKKALTDFGSTTPKAGLEDLREELKKSFSPDQVNAFFAGLQGQGINTLEEFQNASDDSVIAILGSLKDAGFAFAESTDENVKKINDAFDAANIKQSEGKDILKAQLDIIQRFLGDAGQLPSVFDNTVNSLKGFDAPLKTLSTDFRTLLGQLTTFKNADYDKDILLNVSVNPTDSRTLQLLDILFGDGSGSLPSISGPATGNGLSKAEKKEFFGLRSKKNKNKGKLSTADQRRFDELNSLRPR